MWACFARPKPSQHALEFTTTPSQNSPSFSEEVVKHPVTHPEIFLHTLSAQFHAQYNIMVSFKQLFPIG